MPGWLAGVALAIVLRAPQAPPAEDPRAVVAVAAAARAADTIPKTRARWAARVARDSSDRAARLGLATLARFEYDYPTAEREYRRLVGARPDRYTAYARLGLGEGLETRRFSRAARPEFELARLAARASGDRTAEATALLWLAFSRGRLEGVAVAEALLDTTATLIPAEALDLLSGLHARRAITQAIRGRPKEALTEAELGVSLARSAKDPEAEAEALRMMGQVLQYRGAWDSALTALHQSEEAYRAARSRSALANSLIWHAQVLGGTGRYGEMREVMRRALTEGEATNNPAAVADARRAFGVLAAMFGDWPAAAGHLRAAAEISRSTGDSSSVTTTEKYLARVAIVAGDLATARRLTVGYLDWARRVSDPVGLHEANVTLADIEVREHHLDRAAAALAEARLQLRWLPGPNRRIWLLHSDARLALARGDLPAAIRLLDRFISGKEGRLGPAARFDGRVRLADVRARRGEIGLAERELVGATDELEQWRAGLSDAELRVQAFQLVATIDAATQPEAIAGAAGRVIAAMVEAGRIDAAFAVAERWRARDLMDRMARAAALRTSQPAPTALGSLASASPRTAAEVQAALPNDRVAMIEFVASPNSPITAFVLDRRGIRGRVLASSDSLTRAIARFGGLIESGADAADLGRRLSEALIAPLLPLVDTSVTSLVLVPDGVLIRLPFDALQLVDGRYLLERYAVGIAPSASVAAALWSRSTARAVAAPLRLLAFGNPRRPATRRESADSLDDGVRSLIAAAAGLPPLEGAAREARLVARYAPAADLRLGRKASAEFLKQTDLTRYRVLHFATHAIVDDRSLAGVALALAPSHTESGIVGLGDLAALRLDADLVVLSACNSAGGPVVSGEGVRGLTTALLQAGARAVVATRWGIDDRRTVSLVEGLYTGLAQGLPLLEALRAAKVGALRAGVPMSTWAAFTAIGDPFVVIPLRPPPRRWWSRIVDVLRGGRAISAP